MTFANLTCCCMALWHGQLCFLKRCLYKTSVIDGQYTFLRCS